MNTPFRTDEVTRRSAAQMIAAKFLGLTFLPTLARASAQPGKSSGGQAQSCIFIRLSGGISHVDSFDIKEDNKDANRNSSPIKSSADGIRVGKYFTETAKHMDRFAVINSMQHTEGVHHFGQYLMDTGYVRRGSIGHPDLGGWVSKLGERRSGAIPPFVKVGSARGGLGAGFFAGKYGALPVVDPTRGALFTKLPAEISEEQFGDRMDLLKTFNQDFQSRYQSTLTANYHDAYDDAIALMNSEDLSVFKLEEESAATREGYGSNQFGSSCLLARRLVEQGVSFITLTNGGWDDHYGIYDGYGDRAVALDQSLGALMGDLKARGLLETTIVAVTTEFGRDATLGSGGGRGHNPRGYTSMLAGGGIQGGQKYGKTDKLGQTAVENIVSVGDYHSTIGYALGLDVNHIEMSPTERPFSIGNDGQPLTMLF